MQDWIVDTSRKLDQTIRPTVLETPLVERVAGGRQIWCKQENLQTTGSFKIRGAMAKLLSLESAELERGVLTASTGNHGAGVALAGKVLGAHVTVFVPESADPSKLQAITDSGASLHYVPGDPVQCELAARQQSEASGRIYVPPYNDRQVIAGQGTVGVELTRQIDEVGAVVVSVGGGGLISGIAAVVKKRWPDAQIVAASAENSSVMHDSIAAGHIVEEETLPTLSDGTAGGVEPGAMTYQTCSVLVDQWLTVSEQGIAKAMVAYLDAYDDPIEGSAAVALAVAAKLSGDAGPSVVVLCGGNVSDASMTRAHELAQG